MPANFVEIQIKADNSAKLDLAALRAQLDALGRKVAEAKVSIDDKMAAARLLDVNAKLIRLNRMVASPRIRLEGAARAEAQIAMLSARLEALGGGGGGGFLSRLFGGGGGGIGGILAKIGGWQIGPVPVGVIAAAAAALPALGGAIGGTLGIIPLLAAATLGVGAFGALALPTFSKVTAGVTALGAATTKADIAKAWAGISPAIRPLVRDVLALQNAWSAMAAKLQPFALLVAGLALDIGRKLLPALLPLAQAGAKGILGLLAGFDKFATSPGFKAFIAEMTKLAGPAIFTIGEGLGKVTIALGRLLLTLVNPRALAYLAQLFHVIAVGIDWLSNLIHWWTIAGDAVGRFIARAGPSVARFFTADIPNWITVAQNWFARLPGMILRALGNLAGLLVPGGRQLISGLISGIASMLGPLRGIINTVLGVINSLTGLHLQLPGLPSSSHAGQAGGGPVTPPPVGGPHHLVLSFDASGADQSILTALAKAIRVNGGDPAILNSKVVFVGP